MGRFFSLYIDLYFFSYRVDDILFMVYSYCNSQLDFWDRVFRLGVGIRFVV